MIAAVAADPGGPGDAPVMVLADDQVVAATSWSIGDDGVLQVAETRPDGTTASRATARPALIATNAPAPSTTAARDAEGAAAVLTIDGEILAGRILAPDTPGTLRLDVRGVGAERLALDRLAAVRLGSESPESITVPAGAAPPCVLMANGDVVGGAIRGLDTKGVTVESDFGPVVIERSRVTAILCARRQAAPAPDAKSSLCDLADGQRWRVERIVGGGPGATVHLTRAGRDVQIPGAAIRQIVLPGWRAVDLLDQEPTRVDTVPYFGEVVSLIIDGPTRRRPLAIGDRSFAGGLTTRPRSRIVYRVPAEAAYAVGRVGLDPLRGRDGACEVRVESEGQALVTWPVLTPRAASHRFAVALGGRSELTLVTDFGPREELGDCVNWCGLRVLVPAGAPASAPATRPAG